MNRTNSIYPPVSTLSKGKAYHEAGHALLATIFEMEIVKVSIETVDDKGGCTVYKAPHPVILRQRGVFYEGTIEQDAWRCHNVMITLAGEVAQREFCPESILPSQFVFDRQEANLLVKRICYGSPCSMEAKLSSLYEYTRQIIQNPLRVGGLHALASALLASEEISGLEVWHIIRGAIADPIQAAGPSDRGAFNSACPHCAEYDQFD